ncbi:MAG: DNA repair protein RecO [Pseudomonadota bacterium]
MDRVQLTPAWVLHRRDFRDSSQIVELLTAEHGRVSVVAKGIKRPKSRLRGLLQPFRLLRVSWVAKRELGTLTDVDAESSPPTALSGDALLAGYYVSELCLKLTHKHDPHPELFDLYGQVIEALRSSASVDACLRPFEDRLLRELGFGVNWSVDIETGQSVEPQYRYTMVPNSGPRRVADAALEVDSIGGDYLLQIADGDWSATETRRVGRHILARALDVQLEGKTLQTRRVLREMRNHVSPRTNNESKH